MFGGRVKGMGHQRRSRRGSVADGRKYADIDLVGWPHDGPRSAW